MSDVTRILSQVKSGDASASAQLLSRVYQGMRAAAMIEPSGVDK